jgi:hypothetical protein
MQSTFEPPNCALILRVFAPGASAPISNHALSYHRTVIAALQVRHIYFTAHEAHHAMLQESCMELLQNDLVTAKAPPMTPDRREGCAYLALH